MRGGGAAAARNEMRRRLADLPTHSHMTNWRASRHRQASQADRLLVCQSRMPPERHSRRSMQKCRHSRRQGFTCGALWWRYMVGSDTLRRAFVSIVNAAAAAASAAPALIPSAKTALGVSAGSAQDPNGSLARQVPTAGGLAAAAAVRPQVARRARQWWRGSCTVRFARTPRRPAHRTGLLTQNAHNHIIV